MEKLIALAIVVAVLLSLVFSNIIKSWKYSRLVWLVFLTLLLTTYCYVRLYKQVWLNLVETPFFIGITFFALTGFLVQSFLTIQKKSANEEL